MREKIKLEDYDPTLNPALEDILDKKPEEMPRTLMGNVAQIMSWIMVPLLCPVYGILLIFGLTVLKFTDASARFFVTCIVFALCTLLPMILVFIMHLFGLITDVGLNKRNERFVPYAITAACMGLTAFVVSRYGAPIWCSMFFVGGAVAGVVNLIVTFWWKISAHAAGAAGLVALLLRMPSLGIDGNDVLLWLLITVTLTGFLGTCRVYQERHTTLQVFAGYAVGFLSVYAFMLIH